MMKKFAGFTIFIKNNSKARKIPGILIAFYPAKIYLIEQGIIKGAVAEIVVGKVKQIAVGKPATFQPIIDLRRIFVFDQAFQFHLVAVQIIKTFVVTF